MEVFQLIGELGIVPVVQMPAKELAGPLAGTLIKAGLPVMEIMFRNGHAAESIRAVKKEYPQMCVGAGTILTIDQLDSAIEAGADFIVTPGYKEEIVKRAGQMGVPILPGCVTPSEIENGMGEGLSVFKYFPVKAMGGCAALRELEGPYPNSRFVVTGGLKMSELEEYFSTKNVLAAGGDFIASFDEIEHERWEQIEENCAQAIQLSLGFQLAHVGINCGGSGDGEKTAARVAEIFGLAHCKGAKSDFAGNAVECMKEDFPGKAGHIAIGTYSVERAVRYLKSKGIHIRERYRNIAEDGTMIAAYLEEEAESFAIHVVRR